MVSVGRWVTGSNPHGRVKNEDVKIGILVIFTRTGSLRQYNVATVDLLKILLEVGDVKLIFLP